MMEIPEWVTWMIGLGVPTFGTLSIGILWSMREQIAILNTKVDQAFHELAAIERIENRINSHETQLAVLFSREQSQNQKHQ